MEDNNKEPLQMMSLNANGLRNGVKRRSLFNWLKQSHNGKSKIIFLQETHADQKVEKTWKDEWGGEVLFANGTSGSKGVAILLPTNIEYKVDETIIDPGGRYLATKLTISSTTFWLCNCYAPTGDNQTEKLAWLAKIQPLLDQNSDKNVIIGGDLNDVFIPHLDKYKCKPNTLETEYVKAWKTLCNDTDLSDAWRLLNPTTKQYTWRQGGSSKTLRQSRLDYWLSSNHMLYELVQTSILPGFRSDHSLLTISFFKKETSERGPSYWRFNANLLRDTEYIQFIKDKITTFKVKYENEQNHGLKWDLIKMEIRSSSICYSKTKALKNRNNIKEITLKLTALEKTMATNPTDELLEERQRYISDIEAYNNEKAAGIFLRAKADWTEFGEKNTKYFLNLEKRNYNNKCITKLIKENKDTITDKKEILNYELEFYKTLYTNPKTNTPQENDELFHFFNTNNIPKISQAQIEKCESDINIEEVGKALKDLQNGKSPGTDGFTPDFYTFFWPDIKNIVYESIIYAKQSQQLSIEQRRGVINLIPKKEKDIRHLKNWRPISLLNTDYKIITKLLASRVKQALPDVIDEDQVAYLKNRYIGQNIRLIFDIMEHTKDNKKPGILTFLDFENAFDTINWKVIQDALTTFGFGETLKNWVKIDRKSVV
jgi:exonuclease III